MEINLIGDLNINQQKTNMLIYQLIAAGVVFSSSGSEGVYLTKWKINPFGDKLQFCKPTILGIAKCGNFAEEKVGTYLKFSMEKAVRLAEMHVKFKHYTSRQSMDESKELYPGALYADITDVIYSASGAKSKWDEYLSLANHLIEHKNNFFVHNQQVISNKDLVGIYYNNYIFNQKLKLNYSPKELGIMEEILIHNL